MPSEILADLDRQEAWWIALSFSAPGRGVLVYKQIIHLTQESAWSQYHYDRFVRRWALHSEIRRFFVIEGFLETHTPSLVACPGMEPYLDSFAVGKRFLRTSPELHMKRVLAMGFDRVFQMGSCFRAGDQGRHHREEFLMLEWYRIFADLQHIILDLEQLLKFLAPHSTNPDYFTTPFEIVSCQELFKKHLELDLAAPDSIFAFKAALKHRGIPFSDADDWDTLYFLLFLNTIESKLGRNQPTIVTHYPVSQAALAKLATPLPGEMPYCHRLELYINGLEIANAFYELTDPVEQRARFEKDREERRALGKIVYEIDEPFMAALHSGIPPSAGIALGVDRLVLSILGLENMEDLIPFFPGIARITRVRVHTGLCSAGPRQTFPALSGQSREWYFRWYQTLVENRCIRR